MLKYIRIKNLKYCHSALNCNYLKMYQAHICHTLLSGYTSKFGLTSNVPDTVVGEAADVQSLQASPRPGRHRDIRLQLDHIRLDLRRTS